MAKIDELTEAQLSLADQVAGEYIDDLTVYRPPDMEVINRWLGIVYKFHNLNPPGRVEVVSSPMSALGLAARLTHIKYNTTDNCGVGNGGWLAFYDFWCRAGVLQANEIEDVSALRDFTRVVWDTVLLDECAIIIQRPTTLKVDDFGNLHCSSGPALVWADGEKEWAWHGTWVTERVILSPQSFNKEEYLAITNTEMRRALSEAAGWGWVMELLGADVLDVWVDPETQLQYRLLSTGTDTLLQKQSPVLKGGEQPVYLEPVHEDLKTARAARKWQATRLTPEECEKDSVLFYGVES